MVKNKDNTWKYIVAVVAVLFFILIIAVGSLRSSNNYRDPYPVVSVYGTIGTTGLGTYPVDAIFVGADGRVFNTQANNGNYRIDLPNRQSYDVYIKWAGALGVTDRCNVGTLGLNVNSNLYPSNLKC